MAIITFSELASIRENNPGKTIGFCSGSFDLTHAGHAIFLEDCKKHVDILVVMVGNDFNLRVYKGPMRPVLNEHIRLKMISSLKSVDYALLDLDAEDHDVFKIFPTVYKELKPDILFLNDDGFDIPMREKQLEGTGIKLVIMKRNCPPEFENISTTKIIEKIQGSKK